MPNSSTSTGIVTDMTATVSHNSGTTNSLLVTSGTDGRVCLLDVRQKESPVWSCSLPRVPQEQPLSVAVGYQGQLLAAGSSKSQIHFYDIRQTSSAATSTSAPLGSYVDAHTEEVTKVRFQPVNDSGNGSSTLLATASEDGLVCTFDTSQPSEEMALKSVMNIQSPVRQVQFFGPNYEGLCCLTGSETMSVWHHDAAQRIHDYCGHDLRQQLQLQLTSSVMDNVMKSNELYSVEYLVDCHWHTGGGGKLLLLTGNQWGNSAMVQVDAGGTMQPIRSLQNGHKGVIRGWCPISVKSGTNDSSGNMMTLVTVGEDARLCEWKCPLSDDGGMERDDVVHGGDAAMREIDDTPMAVQAPIGGHVPNNKHGGGGGKIQRRHQRSRPPNGDKANSNWKSNPY
jgi:WD40 repeat protein